MTNDTGDEWLEPDHQMGMWEYQVQPRTVGAFRNVIQSLDDQLPVRVELNDGSDLHSLGPMHIGLNGTAGSPRRWSVLLAPR